MNFPDGLCRLFFIISISEENADSERLLWRTELHRKLEAKI